jgi:Ca-activated chloride channel family protein
MKWRNAAFFKWTNVELLEKQLPGLSNARPKIKFISALLALAFIILALTNFQFLSPEKNQKRQGVDVAIVLDVSASMLSQDVQPSRMEAAKQLASQIITGTSDNRIALVTFAGTAITMVPLTPDHSSVEMMLDAINTNTIPQQGSDLGEAIRQAIRSLPNNQNHYKAILLISDGEDHEQKISEALEIAAQTTTVIFTVGVGTTKGGDIPLAEKNESISVKKDSKGEVVITKLQPTVLKEIAKRTGGKYFHYQESDKNVAPTLLKQVAAIGSNEYNQKVLSGYEAGFQYFLFPALLLLIVELFIRNRKRIWG